MDIIIAIIYIVLFIIMMSFVFSVGMLRQFMPKNEIILVLIVGFLIGCIGGAFFLDPVYEELPSVVNVIQSHLPDNEETLNLDLSSSLDLEKLKKNLSSTDGFISFEEESITIPMWSFNEREKAYFEDIVGNIDSHYENYTVTTSGNINIELEDNYSANSALKSFSNWYKLVYGETISYAQVHSKLVIEASSLDTFEDILLDYGVVATSIEGPVQDSVNNTNSSMLSNIEFTLVCGGIGVVVAVIGIYFDNVVPAYRRFKKSMREKRKR